MAVQHAARQYSITVSDQPSAPRRDRLRELLDAVIDTDNADVADMARSSFASAFHFSRQVSRLTGEPPAALRRRVMLERAAWRLQRGEGVAAVATDEGWSSPEERVSPGQVVLDWDGEEPSVGSVLGAIVWTKRVWLASIEGLDQPERRGLSSAAELADEHRVVAGRWTAMIAEQAERGGLGDLVIDALCDPPESFQLYGIVAHVLTYSAHRRELVRAMMTRQGLLVGRGDPLDWMRGN